MYFNILVLFTSALCVVYCVPSCGENEVYTRCKSACKSQICEQNKEQRCDDNNKCQPGCECIDDFLRNINNVCVPKEFCSLDYFESVPKEYFDQVSGEEFILEVTDDDHTTEGPPNTEESNTELFPNAYMAKQNNKIEPNKNRDFDSQQTEDEDWDMDQSQELSKTLKRIMNQNIINIDNNYKQIESLNKTVWSLPPFSKFTEDEQATEETTKKQTIQTSEDNVQPNAVSASTQKFNQGQDDKTTGTDEKESNIPVKIDQNNPLDPPRYNESESNNEKRDHRPEYERRPIYNDEKRDHRPEYERRPIYNDIKRDHRPEYERRPIYNDIKQDNRPKYEGRPIHNDEERDHRPQYERRPIYYDEKRRHGPEYERHPVYNDENRDHRPEYERRPVYNDEQQDHRPEYERRPVYNDENRDHRPEYERRPVYNDEQQDHRPEYERRPVYKDENRDHRPEYKHRVINRRHPLKCRRRSGERTRCRFRSPKHWKPKYHRNHKYTSRKHHRSHVRSDQICKRRYGKLLCYLPR